MPCEHITLPDGTPAIICSRKSRPRKCACGKPATKLCDHPKNKLGDTCDAPICAECAVSIGPDRDLCPKHAKARTSGQLDFGDL